MNKILNNFYILKIKIYINFNKDFNFLNKQAKHFDQDLQ